MSSPDLARLAINIRVLDEQRLRQFAAERMAKSGFESDPAVHLDQPLANLLFEALIGSNPDTVSPIEMGIEIMDWADASPAASIPDEIKETLSEGLLASINAFNDNDEAFGDYTADDLQAFTEKMKAAYAWLGEEMPE